MSMSALRNRAELQQLTNDRVDDAKVWLKSGRWTAAHYLVGYLPTGSFRFLTTCRRFCFATFRQNARGSGHNVNPCSGRS